MRRLAAVALAIAFAACGHNNPPPPLPHIALPAGAALKPYDPSNPGLARPLGAAQLGSLVYVALSNERANFTVGGPGMLAAVTPSTGLSTLIDLGGADEKQCTDPSVVRADSNKLYVTCSDSFDPTSEGRRLVEVDPNTQAVSRTAAIPNGFVPGGIAAAPAKIWMGDSGSGTLFSVDRTTFTAADGADASHPPIAASCPASGTFVFIADVAIIAGDLWALCSTSDAGVLGRYDPTTGHLKDHVAVGATPVALAGLADGRIAVVNSNDNTLALVTTGTPLSATIGFTYQGSTSTLQDVKARDHFVYTVASGSNTVQKIDLTAAGGPKVVSEKNTAPPNAASACINPWNVIVLDDDHAVVSCLLSDALAGLDFSVP
jgi:hypothetical protein